MLRLEECVAPTGKSTLRQELPNHFKENKRILKLMRDNNISFA